jgi:hypothetical protein
MLLQVASALRVSCTRMTGRKMDVAAVTFGLATAHAQRCLALRRQGYQFCEEADLRYFSTHNASCAVGRVVVNHHDA